MVDAITLLKQVYLFKHLEGTELQAIAAQTREVSFKKNAILMTEGDIGESMYIIRSGSVKVFVSDSDGKELILYHQNTGSIVGDIALLDDAPRSASVTATEATHAFMISKAKFLDLLREHPELSIGVIRSLTQRLREATEGSRRLALDNVYQRLTDKLTELKVTDSKGQDHLPRKFSHQELGNMIGASREMVGKVMAELIKGEYVELDDGILYLRKKFPKDW
jgi:CRP/FNR family transcriptional regulator, cyclic AMP receptor protein